MVLFGKQISLPRRFIKRRVMMDPSREAKQIRAATVRERF
jgi:hypothetical protein